MITLKTDIRKETRKKVKNLRKKGILPAVLYGPSIKNLSLEINLKDFEKVFKEAGETSLVSLEADKKKFLVLIHAVELDALSQKPIHVDFYQPKLDEEITAAIPLVFEGESLAVKDLGGTLVKNIHQLEVRALPQNLPHEIKVNIGKLAVFGNTILVKDLVLPSGVKVLKNPEEIIALVAQPQKVEEELAKPIEERVEEVEKVEKGKMKEEEKQEEPLEKPKE